MEIKDIRNPVKTIYGGWLEQFGKAWEAQIKALKAKFKKSIQEVRYPGKDKTDIPIVFVASDALVDVVKFMKKEKAFDYNFLADITATDEMPREPRFDVVYHLFSQQNRWRIRLKVKTDEKDPVPTLCGVWQGANWAEREVWDMFGIKFEGHPDLRRILMDENWEGHPLRKDYPLKGYQIYPLPEAPDEELLK